MQYDARKWFSVSLQIQLAASKAIHFLKNYDCVCFIRLLGSSKLCPKTLPPSWMFNNIDGHLKSFYLKCPIKQKFPVSFVMYRLVKFVH